MTAEGYITALPHFLYDKLQPFTQSRGNTTDGNSSSTSGTTCLQVPHSEQRDDAQQQGAGNDFSPVDLSANADVEGRHRRRGRKKGKKQRRHPRQSGVQGVGNQQHKRGLPRPPRLTTHHREHRMDEALDELHALERSQPHDRPAINKARRRVGRIRSAINQHLLRHKFDTGEKSCVEEVLSAARVARYGYIFIRNR